MSFSDFKKINGRWIPMKTSVQTHGFNKQLGAHGNNKTVYKRTRVILDPDHDALNSFAPNDITYGATVVLVKDGQRIKGKFSWQNGHVTDSNGKKVDL
jgi:hypothetical protein